MMFSIIRSFIYSYFSLDVNIKSMAYTSINGWHKSLQFFFVKCEWLNCLLLFIKPIFLAIFNYKTLVAFIHMLSRKIETTASLYVFICIDCTDAG